MSRVDHSITCRALDRTCIAPAARYDLARGARLIQESSTALPYDVGPARAFLGPASRVKLKFKYSTTMQLPPRPTHSQLRD